jgi:NAD(P)-dependent dehydrogenase (short-subunit alcohol dehydrogenase family)
MDSALAPRATPLQELIDLSGRTAIVTGGAVGIGSAIARRLHETGADIVVADVQAERASSAVDQLLELRAESALRRHGRHQRRRRRRAPDRRHD